jgi:hypothetical protein
MHRYVAPRLVSGLGSVHLLSGTDTVSELTMGMHCQLAMPLAPLAHEHVWVASLGFAAVQLPFCSVEPF